MKVKNGFTLIELLAVIVILAIIALVAVPIILNIVDEAKKSSFKDSAYGIVDAAGFEYTQETIRQTTASEVAFDYNNGVESSTPGGRKLAYRGENPKEGLVLVNSAGKVAMALHNGTYCASKGYDDGTITLSEMTLQQCEQTLNADNSGAAAPEITANMIPITWNGSGWIKANVVNYIGSNQWYNYSEQQWANVALVSQDSRASYVSAPVGSSVQPADVMAYLVWVPRYKYKLFNVSSTDVSVQTIDVVFEDRTTTKSTGSTNGTYLTHPAFTMGAKNVNGIWVGKFESTGNSTTPTIKPTTSSLRSQSVSLQFTISKKFNTATTYGLTDTNDAHLMKNTEWGAVAYLSQSDYGKYGNTLYTDTVGLEKVIWKNPSSYQTGCAGDTYNASYTSSCNNAYQTPNGQKSSTTGNVYGIYDMVGGGWEYVMGAQYSASGGPSIQIENSGFDQATIDGASMTNYINKYAYGVTESDATAYNRRILGDATGETKAWATLKNFSYSMAPWFLRGGGAGDDSQIYCFFDGDGNSRGDVAFRVVLFGE